MVCGVNRPRGEIGMTEKETKKRPRSTLNDILAVVRLHYQQNYPGSDTDIDDSNVLNQVSDICRRNVELEFRIKSIRKLVEEG
jgi:hypothetical protein